MDTGRGLHVAKALTDVSGRTVSDMGADRKKSTLMALHSNNSVARSTSYNNDGDSSSDEEEEEVNRVRLSQVNLDAVEQAKSDHIWLTTAERSNLFVPHSIDSWEPIAAPSTKPLQYGCNSATTPCTFCVPLPIATLQVCLSPTWTVLENLQQYSSSFLKNLVEFLSDITSNFVCEGSFANECRCRFITTTEQRLSLLPPGQRE